MKRHIILAVPFAIPAGAEVEIAVSCGGKSFIRTTLEVSPFRYAIGAMNFAAVPAEIISGLTACSKYGCGPYLYGRCTVCGSP